MKNKLLYLLTGLFLSTTVFAANQVVTNNNDSGVTPASGTVTSWADQMGAHTFTASGNPQTVASKVHLNNVVGLSIKSYMYMYL